MAVVRGLRAAAASSVVAAARNGSRSRRGAGVGGLPSSLLAMASIVSWFSGGRGGCGIGIGMATAAKPPPPLFQSPLVTAEQVRASLAQQQQSGGGNKNNQQQGRIRFLDASWHLDKTRSPQEEFVKEHIKGAARFDIDKVADPNSKLPHMLPSAEAFGEAASALGLENTDEIVVYTTEKCFSAARCWWTFRVFGHDKVYILEGGLPAWKAAGGETEAGEAQVTPSRPPKGLVEQGGNRWLLDKKGFQAKLRPELVYSWQQVLKVVEAAVPPHQGGPIIVDARGGPRFRAEVAEPRPGLERGHIPGSFNLPFDKLLVEGDWTRFRTPEEIRAAYKEAGVDLGSLKKGQVVVTSCGSGVTAAVLSLAMVLAGARDVSEVPVYDGAWAEWGGRADLPKEPKQPPPQPQCDA